MKRKPGYLFEVTIAKSREDDSPVDAIQGARIEVYNNTTKKEVLNYPSHPDPTFHVNFEQGNHYTILIRKENYYNKRMEAYVNVKGCILCFEGIGSVRPGVSDVLTEGNKMGTLLANVELEPLVMNKAIKFENIYYDYNSARIKSASRVELDKLINILKINPSLLVELSSHTDSRGKDSYNLKLSQKRAEAAAAYVAKEGSIDSDRVRPKGYGETKLVNKCKNGVKCSDKQHQENRRTEFKIVGFRKDRFHNMSLVDILEEERLEALLVEIQNQEVVRVEEGEELPEEIKKQLAANTDSTEVVSPKEEAEPPGEIAEPVEKKASEPTISPAAEGQLPDQPKVSTGQINPEIPVQSTPSLGQTSPDQAEPVVSTATAAKVSDLPEPKEATAVVEPTKSLIVQEQSVDIRDTRRLPKPMPEYYTGYKVEFYTAAYELPSSHEIFSRHGNISTEKLADGTHAYLLGDFTDWKAANSFLNKIMVSRYPDARIVRYKNGERLK